VIEHSASLFVDDFIFLEAPRWHKDRLWVSDVFDHKVYTLKIDGSREVVCEVPNRPSGLGFFPDGTPIIVSSKDRKILKLVDNKLLVLADLSQLATGAVNDFAVDAIGRIYVGNFGYDYDAGEPARPTNLHMVQPDGTVSVAASGVEFPNGSVIKDGGTMLLVAETWACRIRAFDIALDGGLSCQRVYADLGKRQPDGICLDAHGGLWVACFNTGEFIRILEGGDITDRVALPGHAVSPGLGGDDGKTLFLCSYLGTTPELVAGKRRAGIHTLRVDVPGAAFGKQ